METGLHVASIEAQEAEPSHFTMYVMMCTLFELCLYNCVHVYVSYKQSLIITKTMFVRYYELLIYVYSNCCFCIEPYVPITSNDQVFRTIFIVVPTLGQLLVFIWNHQSIWKLFFITHSSFCDLATFVEGTGRCFLTFVDISEVFLTREPSS